MADRPGRRRDRVPGSHDRPYSALNLRLALAIFGLVSTVVLAVLLWRAGFHPWAVVMAVFGVAAAVDIVVVVRRRRARRREHPEIPHSLFN